jgi:hypothetical protein
MNKCKRYIGCMRMNPICTTRMQVYAKRVQTSASPSDPIQGETRDLRRGKGLSELR